MKKRGYFFVSDAVIALFILVLGSILALSFFSYQSSQEQVSFLSGGIMDFMYSHRLKDLNSDLIGPNRKLYKNKNITDMNTPLILQLGEFYYRNQTKNCGFCLELIEKVLENVSGDFVADQYSFAFFIEGEMVYNQTSIPVNESEVLVPSKTIIHGIYREKEIWGPYTAEVWTWR